MLELVSELRRRGLQQRLFSHRERLRQRLAEPVLRERLLCVVAAGGDGTVGDVINRYPDLPTAILPLGTENLLARYLRIPRSGRLVAQMIADGRTRRIDLGQVGNRRFTIMASLGFDADVIHRAHARRSGHVSRLSYLQPIWQSLRNYEYPALRLYLDGAETPIRARLAVLANLPTYALGLPMADSACDNDGLLDLRLFQRHSAFQMFRYFYKVASGRHERLVDVTSLRARQIRIESDRPAPIQVDGDPAGWTPVEICVLPAALELLVPPAE